jgi:signal transduction histidine kinase
VVDDAGPRLGRGELPALDWLVAAGLLLLFLSLPGDGGEASDAGDAPLAVRLALVAAMALPVAASGRWPLPVLCVVAAASVAAEVGGVISEPFVSVAFALFRVAVTAPGMMGAPPRPPRAWGRVPTRAVGIGSVVLLLGGMVAGSPVRDTESFSNYLVGVSLAGMAWTAGRAVRERRAYAARSAQQYAARAVAEERLRIARELHDVVAHHIGVITVKAGVANHVLPVRPEEAGEALRAIETASRSALTEMRQLLGVLRDGAEPGHPGEPAGLSALPALVERAAAAGVPVEVRASGIDGLPDGVDRSAFRIVQEAVTNVMKHAAPARCVVVLAADGDELRIDVTNDGGHGVGRESTGGGHGLIGMRERVALYGGELHAGRRAGGGFAVRARLPCQPAKR